MHFNNSFIFYCALFIFFIICGDFYVQYLLILYYQLWYVTFMYFCALSHNAFLWGVSMFFKIDVVWRILVKFKRYLL